MAGGVGRHVGKDAVRKAVSLGGDSDTIACIAGGIAGAAYGVPDDIRTETLARLDDPLRGVLAQFAARWPRQAASG